MSRFVNEFSPQSTDVAICGSMAHRDLWMPIIEELKSMKLNISTPELSEAFDWSTFLNEDITREKRRLVRRHIANIQTAKIVLIANFDKNGIENYIGTNTFLEMVSAFTFEKPIYLYNPVPKQKGYEEILALEPIILNADLSKTKHHYMKSEIKIKRVGYEIFADWYETSKSNVLLILPGFTSTKLRYEALTKALVKQTGYSALVIDYAGHGKSPYDINDLTRADNSADAIAAFDWLKTHYPDKEITVIGTSYGGYHAAYLTKFREFKNVIFRVPASYPEETMYTKIGDMEDAHSEEYRNSPDNYVNHWLFTHTQSVTGRALLVTHELDTVCPPVATQPFAEAFNGETWEAPGFEHGFGQTNASDEQLEHYYKKLADWINDEVS